MAWNGMRPVLGALVIDPSKSSGTSQWPNPQGADAQQDLIPDWAEGFTFYWYFDHRVGTAAFGRPGDWHATPLVCDRRAPGHCERRCRQRLLFPEGTDQDRRRGGTHDRCTNARRGR